MAESFPRRHARTQGFTLGRPRGFQVGADGARVAFLRSAAGDDPVNRLWVLEVASGAERLVADPAGLLGDGPADLPPEERARRERARERAGGIVAFAADLDLRVASFTLAGRLFVADLGGPDGEVRELPVGEGVLDPRVDPTGRRVAWVAGRSLHVARIDGADPRQLVGEDDPEVTWGLAEFLAAEEMDRSRGFWTSVYGRMLDELSVWIRTESPTHAPDAVNVNTMAPGGPRVYVDDELVTPEDTLKSPSPGGTLVSAPPKLTGDQAYSVQRALRVGVAPSSRPGRADDFRWPNP